MSLNAKPRRKGTTSPSSEILGLRSREQAASGGGAKPRTGRSPSEFRPPEFSPPTRQNEQPSLSEAAQRPETDPEKRKGKKEDRPHLSTKQKRTRDITDTLYENVADVAPRNAVGLALLRGVAGARLGGMVGEQIEKSRYDDKQKKKKDSGGEGMSEMAHKGRLASGRRRAPSGATGRRRRRRSREDESERG